MADHNDRIDPEDLQCWEAPALSDAFEDRVLDALDERSAAVDEVSLAPRSRKRIWVLGLAAAAAVILSIGLWQLVPRATVGERVFDSAQTVTLSSQVTVQARAGAHLSWRIEPGGEARIEQRRGAALYDVAPGERFEVVTPSGVIEVTGTLFEVEVFDMQNPIPKRFRPVVGIAAAIATAVVVYEGAVILRNDHGRAAASPGNPVAATATAAPAVVRTPPSKPTGFASAPSIAGPKPKQDPTSRRAITPAQRTEMTRKIKKALATKQMLTPPTTADDGEWPPIGTLSKDYIRERISEDLIPLARECYNDVLADDPKAGGRVVLKFTIMGDEDVGGLVEDVSLGEDTDFVVPTFLECVQESMHTVAFAAPPEDGGLVSVTYPLVFEPDTDGSRSPD